MGHLRDIFAKLGVCDTTVDLERKPDVVKTIMGYSIPLTLQTSPDNPQFSPYAERLREVLMDASTTTLDMIARDKIVVCLDSRLSCLKSGFLDSAIYSVFYNNGNGKVLSLYDNGKSGKESRFFETTATTYGCYAINGLSDLSQKLSTKPMIIGNMVSTGKSMYFRWDDAKDFSKLLKKNPELMNPPVINSFNPVQKPTPL